MIQYVCVDLPQQRQDELDALESSSASLGKQLKKHKTNCDKLLAKVKAMKDQIELIEDQEEQQQRKQVLLKLKNAKLFVPII